MSDEQAHHTHSFATIQIPLTDRQAYLYRNNAAFKTIVDTFIQAHLPVYLRGAEEQADEYARRMEADKIRAMTDVPRFRQERLGAWKTPPPRPCDICNDSGFDYLGRPCRIHGPKEDRDDQ